jgi:dTDP-4-dehydrorhamnose 3,5-epimerase-like enzyme
MFSRLAIGSDGSEVLRFCELNFPVNRIYWLSGPSGSRGGHAHKNLRQAFFCLSGEVRILLKDGTTTEELELTRGQGVQIAPGLWRDIYPLDEGSVLLIAASDKFDEDDYIRNFEEFELWKNA